MPRPLTLALGAGSAIGLMLVLGVFIPRHKPPHPTGPAEEQDTVGGAAPSDQSSVAGAKTSSQRKYSVTTPVVSTQHRQAIRSDAGAVLDESSLMAKLHALAGTDPPLTLQLAREGNVRFPESPDAPERTWMIVKSLANMQQFKDAHREAEMMVKRYPGTSWSLDVQRHLLSNPLD